MKRESRVIEQRRAVCRPPSVKLPVARGRVINPIFSASHQTLSLKHVKDKWESQGTVSPEVNHRVELSTGNVTAIRKVLRWNSQDYLRS